MSLPRRRIVHSTAIAPNPQRHRQVQKLRERLEHEQATLARWQSRLNRAFNTVAKSQKRITRIQNQLARIEE